MRAESSCAPLVKAPFGGNETRAEVLGIVVLMSWCIANTKLRVNRTPSLEKVDGRAGPVTLAPVRPFAPEIEPRSLTIVWQHEDLVAIDKPAGLLSQGGPSDGAHGANVVDLARAQFGSESVGVLHRLDRNVSGLVLVSLAKDVAEGMSRAFADGSVERRYEAISKVPRALDGAERVVDVALVKDERTNLVRVARPNERDAKPARTRIAIRERVQAPMGWLACIDCWPITGRSHQIRVHLAHIGMPLVGDPKYGVGARSVTRPLLHATALSFVHPRTKERIEIASKPPWRLDDLRALAGTSTKRERE
jgi:RluA family pseudouridine synthase